MFAGELLKRLDKGGKLPDLFIRPGEPLALHSNRGLQAVHAVGILSPLPVRERNRGLTIEFTQFQERSSLPVGNG